MCCAGMEWPKDTKPNGECPECCEPTVDGEAYNHCGYGHVECETCDYAPCDGSC